MPVPVGAIIGAAATIGSTAFNAGSAAKTNRQSRKFAVEQYQYQRADALSDYERQNAYNSPSAQMQRLREAGLNPNLMYGDAKGAEAAPVRSSQSPQWSPHAPQVDASTVGDQASKFYDVLKTNEETDNLRKQNTVLVQEAALKEAQRLNVNADTANKLVTTDTGMFDLDLKNSLRQNQLDMRDAELKQKNLENEKIANETTKIRADTAFTLNQDERNASLNSSSLREAAERILTMRAQRAKTPAEIREINARIKNIEQDTRIKTADADLKNKGIQPHDPAWQRRLIDILDIPFTDSKDKKGNSSPKSAAYKYAPWKPF